MGHTINWQWFKKVSIPGVLLCGIVMFSTVTVAGESQEETLAWCETLANAASEVAYAAKNELNYPLIPEALELANDAEALMAEVSRQAQDTGNQQLALSAYIVSNKVKEAIAHVIWATEYIAARGHNSEDAHAAKMLLGSCRSTQTENEVTMGTALVALFGIPESVEAYSE